MSEKNVQTAYTHLSKFYDEFMTGAPEWTDYLCEIFNKYSISKGRIAEVACGSGRVSIPVKKRGYDLVCCDISPQMLSRAQESARKEGVQIAFVKQDMCKLDVGKCRAVFAACDALNYLTQEEDASAFFARAYSALNSGGILTFDISSEYKYRNILADKLYFEDTDAVTYFWQNSFTPPLLNMEITIFTAKGDMYERQDEEHTQRCWQVDELKSMLGETGFSDVQCWEFGTFNPPNECERIQFVAVK